MYICNTGLDCEDCVGGCDQNLEWDDELALNRLVASIGRPNESPQGKE